MTTRDDQPRPDEQSVIRAYRAASARLDEAPPPQARSAILAAAARAVQAGPRAVANPFRRFRLPLAAAAAVLISTVAVLLTQRTETLPPAPPADGAPSRAPTAPDGAGPEAAPPVRATEAPPPGTPSQAALSEQRPTPPASDAARRPIDPAAPAPRSESAVAARTPDAAAATSAAAEPLQADAVGPDRVHADARPPAPADVAAAASASEGRVTARPVARSGAVDAAPWRADEQRWLQRVIELRGAGRHDEADTELALLRARYPQLRIPAQALRPAQN
jgi:hypothetical protein